MNECQTRGKEKEGRTVHFDGIEWFKQFKWSILQSYIQLEYGSFSKIQWVNTIGCQKTKLKTFHFLQWKISHNHSINFWLAATARIEFYDRNRKCTLQNSHTWHAITPGVSSEWLMHTTTTFIRSIFMLEYKFCV